MSGRQGSKIAFCGTHGSGKTTLAQRVASELGLPFHGSVARKWLLEHKMSFSELLGQPEQLREFQLYCFEQAGKLKPPYVVDRTVFDMAAYSIATLGRNLLFSPIQYSVVFFLPFNPSFLKKDGVRDVDEHFAKAMHHLIKGVLYLYKVDFVEVKSIKLENRVKEVRDELRRRKIG